MATQKEMDEFYLDQRKLPFDSFSSAATCALVNYDLEKVDTDRLKALIEEGTGVYGLNLMLNDKQGRMLWIRGDLDAKIPITLTFRASQWGDINPGNPFELAREALPEIVIDPLLPHDKAGYESANNVYPRSALDMRKEALALLEKAESLDGLKPKIIMHQHEYGQSGYIGWSNVVNYCTVEEAQEFDKHAELVEAYKLAASKNDCCVADTAEGKKYGGKMLGATEHYIVQSLGKTAVIHLKRNLDRIPEHDELLNIVYDNKGQGKVEPKANEQENTLSR